MKLIASVWEFQPYQTFQKKMPDKILFFHQFNARIVSSNLNVPKASTLAVYSGDSKLI